VSVLKPLGKLARLLGRLAREDGRPESLDGVDALIRPPFARYNRLVGRLSRLEKARQARHREWNPGCATRPVCWWPNGRS
jgi:hypothetical protein